MKITKARYIDATIFPDTVLFPFTVHRQMLGTMAEVVMSMQDALLGCLAVHFPEDSFS